MADDSERRDPPSSSDWLTRAGKRVDVVWGLAAKGGLLALGLFVGALIVYEVGRECLSDDISLEPVIVKAPTGESAPTVEMATQQIATYIDKIQRTGAREWRPRTLDDGGQAINIQIPGSSLTVENIVREIANALPNRRRALKISITARPSGAGYVSAIAISGGGSPIRATCEADNRPDALGKMFECLAVEAMKAIDPLFAASYVLSVERGRCAKFDPKPIPAFDHVAEERRRLELLRDACSFGQTRAVVSAIIDRGNKDDQLWVSYLYSKLHLARARAVAKIDPEGQWHEFDQAIARFAALSRDKVPASALATQMWAYLRNGLSIQESVLALDWQENAALIKQRLDTADRFLKDAAKRLDDLASHPQKAARAVAAKAKPDDEDPLRPMISHLRGVILYRQWMIEAHKRKGENPSEFAEGEAEKAQLRKAVQLFEASQNQAKLTPQLLLQWGNALRALREFDKAIKRYQQAADMAPADYAPLLNVAVALLDKSRDDPTMLQTRFEALRQTSSYLTWISDGGPFDTLPKKIAEALGDAPEAAAFDACRRNKEPYEADMKVRDMSHTAALKLCVDQARDSLAQRVAEQGELVAEQKK